MVSHLCDYTCGTKKLEIRLKKEQEGVNWVSLERPAGSDAQDGVGVRAQAVASGSVPSYPTSSKTKKNWGNVDKDMDAELKTDKGGDDGALNDLFKQIYGRSDEATRRAMIKSYQTSGGTVLSTNWDEVHGKDYEGQDRPEAPTGQQWAKE